MQKRYSYERVKERMLSYGKIMLSNEDNLPVLRNQIYKLKKEGFVINRIGSRGNIKGYRLAPGDYQQ